MSERSTSVLLFGFDVRLLFGLECGIIKEYSIYRFGVKEVNSCPNNLFGYKSFKKYISDFKEAVSSF